MLRVAKRLGEHTRHRRAQDVPRRARAAAGIREPTGRLRASRVRRHVARIAAKERLAEAADVFCERIAFTREQTERGFRRRANSLGLAASACRSAERWQGGEIAAATSALSADHLEYASDASLQLMARNGVVAGLLPGAFYFLRETACRRSSGCVRSAFRWPCRRIAIQARRRSHRCCWR